MPFEFPSRQTRKNINAHPRLPAPALGLIFALQGENRRPRNSGRLGQHLFCGCDFSH